MKTAFIFFLAVLLSFNLVLAVDVSRTKEGYRHGELVPITISNCVGVSSLQLLDPANQVVDVGQGNNNWLFSYHTNSDPSEGKYTVRVSCQDASSAEVSFCVDNDDCLAVPPQEEEEPEPHPAGETPSSGGVGYCQSNWTCTAWNYCNATLKRSRLCVDVSNCRRPDMIEVKNCTACDESWICSLWSGCQSNQQTRYCRDEHYCRTSNFKPVLEKSCTIAASGPAPAQIINQPPEDFAQRYPEVQQPLSLWGKYKSWMIGAPLAVIILVVLIVLLVHFMHHPRKAYNYGELKDWIKKEKAMGTSDQDIKEILMRETGWRGDEITDAFRELKEPSETAS